MVLCWILFKDLELSWCELLLVNNYYYTKFSVTNELYKDKIF